MNEKIRVIIKLVVLLILILILGQFLVPIVGSESFQNRVKDLGILGPLVVIFYTVVSHVLAPISGSPGIILGIAVFGVVKTFGYLYIASLVSCVINFYIARKFGRGWVEKLVGCKSMNDVDNFVANSGKKVLAVSRVFGFTLFELISYGAGLTKISFRDYFWITVVFGAIPNVLIIVFSRNADFSKPEDILKWLGGMVIIGIVFSLMMRKFLLRKNVEKNSL